MDITAVALGVCSITASAVVAIASMRTQRQLATETVRTDRENELRSVLDDAALALLTAHERLEAAIESVDRPPRYDDRADAEVLQQLHEACRGEIRAER